MTKEIKLTKEIVWVNCRSIIPLKIGENMKKSQLIEIINQLHRDIQNLKKENEYLENKIKTLEGEENE